MNPNRKRSQQAVSVVVFGAVLLVLVVLTVTGSFGRPLCFEVPTGLKGWTLIRYRNARCPALASHGIFLVVRVSANGVSCTSNPMPMRWRYIRFEYVTPHSATRAALPGATWRSARTGWWSIVNTEDHKEGLWFIGTPEEFRHSWATEPWPFHGPVSRLRQGRSEK